MIRLTLIFAIFFIFTLKFFGDSPTEIEIATATEEPAAVMGIDVVESTGETVGPDSSVSATAIHRAATRRAAANLIRVGSSDAPESVLLERVSNWSVSAGRVNLRSGPSSRTRVVATLDQGTLTEVIAFEGNWAMLSVRETGQTGYMSRNFLTPAR